VVDSWKDGSESSNLINGKEFLDRMRDYPLVQKGSTPRSYLVEVLWAFTSFHVV